MLDSTCCSFINTREYLSSAHSSVCRLVEAGSPEDLQSATIRWLSDVRLSVFLELSLNRCCCCIIIGLISGAAPNVPGLRALTGSEKKTFCICLLHSSFPVTFFFFLMKWKELYVSLHTQIKLELAWIVSPEFFWPLKLVCRLQITRLITRPLSSYGSCYWHAGIILLTQGHQWEEIKIWYSLSLPCCVVM